MTDTRTIALITGASRGIGHEVARQLAARDVLVLAAVRDPSAAAADLAELAGDVRVLHLDVTDASTIHCAAARVDAEHGHLDILINNAGISLEVGGDPLDVDVDAVRATYETNVFGVVAVTQAFLPLLQRAASARIVNVSSAVGSLGEWSDPESPIVKFAPVSLAYNSSKTALNAITVAYALALHEHGILVNAADPGYVDTELNGNTGYRTVAEGAHSILELALSASTTGGFMSDFGPVRW